MLAYLTAVVLLLASATPAPATRTPVPVPRPTATNPFTLEPIAAPSTLPYIGGTRSRPVCAAIRSAVAPGVQAAMKNDQVFASLRTKIFDYVVKDSEPARDLHLTQMDRTVDQMVKHIDALNDAAKSPALEVTATTKPDEAKHLRDLRRALAAMAIAERTQLDAMSGFVETERMRRFGRLSESEQNLQSSLVPNVTIGSSGQMATPVPISGFLRDTKDAFAPQHPEVRTLGDAHKLDRDLGDIAAFTTKTEEAATRVIVAAANSCKQPQSQATALPSAQP